MLKSGSSGPDVEALQRALLRKGINPGPVDGVFGSKTEDAVRRSQERAGLAADGVAGPKTLSALEEQAAAGAPSKAEDVSGPEAPRQAF